MKTVSYNHLKRVIDVAASLFLCIVLAPMGGVIALAIALESSGSPIFSQQRVGRNGRIFPIYKFRSMVKNAPALGGWHTQDNDPRITRVGKFLRFTSLDELPQLWNVVKGDMSLIGPRPFVPQQASLYAPDDWLRRHQVRPGITGLAQVNGRSSLTQEEQLRYDLSYADHPSLAMDIRIVLKTIRVVLCRVGVN